MFVGKVSLLAITAVGMSFLTSWATAGEKETTNIVVSSSNSMENGIFVLVEKIKSKKSASPHDCARLQLFISQLIGDRLVTVGPDERQRIVQDALGSERYRLVEAVLLDQLKSQDSELRICAIQTLGKDMFSKVSENSIKDFVFESDRRTQYYSLSSLAALGMQGANNLLVLALLSGTLPDLMATDAIEVMLLSDKTMLSEIGPEIISANKGAGAINALMPALRIRKDFMGIVADLFRDDVAQVLDVDRLSLVDVAKANLEYGLLEVVMENYGAFSHDEAIVKKIERYAKSKGHPELYTLALLALERSGMDVKYFENMLMDKATPEQKVKILNLVINRIKKGERQTNQVPGEISKERSR